MAEPCANPLWAEWLRGWWDHAKEHNHRSAVVYKHAYDALRACPITFTHPSELSQLRGFGPKLCARLTSKLQRHCELTGTRMPTIPRGRNRPRYSAAELGQVEDYEAVAAAAARRRRRNTKPYVPAYRSGAYAIIMALATIPEDAQVGLTKPTVIDRAQPHCDASFTAPADPRSFYTAWNSMKTLLNKRLVHEERGVMKRYMLTEDGWRVARSILQTAESASAARTHGGIPEFRAAPSRQPAAGPASTSNTADVMEVGDLDGDNDDDIIDIDGNSMSEDEVQRHGGPARPQFGPSRAEGSSRAAGISRTEGSSRAKGSSSRVDSSSRADGSSRAGGISSRVEGSSSRAGGPSRAGGSSRAEGGSSRVEGGSSRVEGGSSRVEGSSSRARVPESQKGETTTSYEGIVQDGTAVLDASALPTFRPIRLAPGTFTVQLVLDVREIRSKTDRDYMQDELAKQGVQTTTRCLELADALWVARCRDSRYLGRVGAEGDEVVLDWIVERKRLDDLIMSIKDGRFHEQKFRLRRSGVRNVVYLVEDVAVDAMTMQRHEKAVESAIAATQVVDGWFVKRTRGMDDTIRYLARTTALLRDMYESRTLLVIPTQYITAQNYLPLLDKLRREKKAPDDPDHYISYPAFASLASKSELMTLRDVYLKMLMCTRGVTGEKALEIQKRWPTPIDLIRAYEACGTGEDGKKRQRELVARETESLIGREKIGKAVSLKLAEVWGNV